MYMSISERIMSMSANFSKKQNQLGKFILDNIVDVALMNAPQIAREAGVSEATLTRFVYALGFNSFSEFLLELRRETINSKGGQFRQEPDLGADGHIYQRVFDVEMDLMRETLSNIDPASFDAAVKLLLECDHLLLVGGPIHHYISLYALNFMCAYRDNIHIIKQVDMSFVSLLDSLSSKSAAIVFSYPRYSSEVQKIAEILYKKKVQIIGVTDSKLSPVIPLSHSYLITPQKYIILADASASVMALMHALMVAMYKENSHNIKKRLEKYEKSILETEMFVYKDYNFVKKM